MKKIILISFTLAAIAISLLAPSAKASQTEEYSMVTTEHCCMCYYGTQGCQIGAQCCDNIQMEGDCAFPDCPFGE